MEILTAEASNYSLTNKNIIMKVSLLEIAGVDLCVDPEAICRPQYPSLKWIEAVAFWVGVVQGFYEFKPDLEAFVNNGFIDSSGSNNSWYRGEQWANGMVTPMRKQIDNQSLKSSLKL